jgi:hypothetical protein
MRSSRTKPERLFPCSSATFLAFAVKAGGREIPAFRALSFWFFVVLLIDESTFTRCGKNCQDATIRFFMEKYKLTIFAIVRKCSCNEKHHSRKECGHLSP